MKAKTYQTLLVAASTTLTICLTACATSLFWQHQSCIHHAAKFEANNWGWVSFHWNDEFAQIVLVDPVADSLIPPPIETEKHRNK
jgi:hypothetical protein